MYELIVILCLFGEADRCSSLGVVTNSCPGALQQILAAAPEGAAVRGLTCRRAEVQLPPMTVKPEKENTRT